MVGVVLVQASYAVVLDALKTSMTNLAFSLLIAMAVHAAHRYGGLSHSYPAFGKNSKSARQLQEGNYDVRTDIHQEDELGRLAESVDELALRLAKAKQERNRLDDIRSTFITNISHELRTPVTSMRASLEALCDGLVTEPEKVDQYHRAILKDSIQLHRLIHEIKFNYKALAAGIHPLLCKVDKIESDSTPLNGVIADD